jgi:hypothetical protein
MRVVAARFVFVMGRSGVPSYVETDRNTNLLAHTENSFTLCALGR